MSQLLLLSFLYASAVIAIVTGIINIYLGAKNSEIFGSVVGTVGLGLGVMLFNMCTHYNTFLGMFV